MNLLSSQSALVIAACSVAVVREIGAIIRQYGAIRGLERIAAHHPDSAAFLAGVIGATSTPSKRMSRRHRL